MSGSPLIAEVVEPTRRGRVSQKRQRTSLKGTETQIRLMTCIFRVTCEM
jgi:hypothetical protein